MMKPLAEHMAFYAGYHRNIWNKRTHYIGIPMIIFSILIPMTWAAVKPGGVPLTGAMLFVAAVLAYYYVVDVGLAVGMTVFIVPVLYAAHQVGQWPWTEGLYVFLACFVGGWIFQFIGHLVFEKRWPATFSNLFQLIIAPIFFVAEIYFKLGYRLALKDQVERLTTPAPTIGSPR